MRLPRRLPLSHRLLAAQTSSSTQHSRSSTIPQRLRSVALVAQASPQACVWTGCVQFAPVHAALQPKEPIPTNSRVHLYAQAGQVARAGRRTQQNVALKGEHQ